jgi:MFS family permease
MVHMHYTYLRSPSLVTTTVSGAHRALDPTSPAPTRALATVVVLCFGGLCASLMQTLVIPIQGQLGTYLDTSAANASWVITVTLLGGAVAMPIAGSLGDLIGKQRVLIGSAVLLVLGSLLCAVADSLVPMLAGRALQGLAMGFIPVGISLMRDVTPPHMTTTAIATMSATLGVGGAIGLPLSAWVAQSADWHALFWMSAGLALVVTVCVVFVIPHVNDATGRRFDWSGAIGLAVGLVATLVAISKGNGWGWTSGRTLGSLAIGLVVLAGWAVLQLRNRQPLVDLRVTARRPVLFTNAAAVALGFGMMAQSIVVPQLLQLPEETGYGLGQTILQAGLWLAPGGLVMMAFAPVSSTLIRRVGAKITLATGAATMGFGYLIASFLTETPWELLVASCVVCAGVGISYSAMPTLIMASVPIHEAGSAVGVNGLMRAIGTTLAAAVMAALLTGSTHALGSLEFPSESAYHLCFLVGAGAAFLAAFITMGIGKQERAAA